MGDIQKWERKPVTIGKIILPRWIQRKETNVEKRASLKQVSYKSFL
jgi:hypothetical protein